ncbi:hypothetical protein Tco_1217870 [Tanacetum coccineum]
MIETGISMSRDTSLVHSCKFIKKDQSPLSHRCEDRTLSESGQRSTSNVSYTFLSDDLGSLVTNSIWMCPTSIQCLQICLECTTYCSKVLNHDALYSSSHEFLLAEHKKSLFSLHQHNAPKNPSFEASSMGGRNLRFPQVMARIGAAV